MKGTNMDQRKLRKLIDAAEGGDVDAQYELANECRVGAHLEQDYTAPGFFDHTRTTLCNAQGFYQFDRLSDGNYIVHTSITWEVPARFGMQKQGGTLIGRIAIANGASVELTLAPS